MLAARTPQLLRTLTLTNCETDGNIPNPSFRGTIGWAAEGTLAPRLVGMYDRLEQTAPQQRPLGGGHERPQDLPIAVHRAYLEPIAGRLETARDFERLLVAIDPEHLRAAVPGLRELTVPTLVVGGNADPHYGMDWAYWLRDTIPGVTEVVELDGAKLFLPDERAGELVACLRRHWAAAGDPTGDLAGRS
jgi:pimeloyl-ACP methyl ester carboxylesterase